MFRFDVFQGPESSDDLPRSIDAVAMMSEAAAVFSASSQPCVSFLSGVT